MLRRRRPVLRAATMAGGAALAYHAGKNAQAADQYESDQQMGQYQQQPMAATPPTAGGMAPDAMAKLQQLGQLHEQGILTDEEFTEQKRKILG